MMPTATPPAMSAPAAPMSPAMPSAARVIRAAKAGWNALAPDRALYAEMVMHYEGRLRSPILDPQRKPANLIAQLVEAYLTHLCGSGQKTKLKPVMAGNRGLTLIREKMLQSVERKIGMNDVHEAVVRQAVLGGLGIYYTGLRGSDTMIQVDGELFDPGQPFAVSVDLGDFTIDPLARSIEEATFMGHRFRFNVELAKEQGIGKPELLESIPLVDATMNKNPVGASATGEAGRDTLFDLAEAWNLVFWDGRRTMQGVVVELAGGSEWLVDPIPYSGPERGPYELLRFTHRANRATGLSPAERVRDLHIAIGEVSGAIVRQVVDTDRKLVVDNGQQELADDLTNKARRVVFGDPKSVAETTVGGLAREMVPGYELLKSIAAEEGINLQQALGTGTNGDATATEASIVAGKALQVLKKAKGKANAARARVSKRLSAWLDDDLITRQTFSHRMQGGDHVELVWDPAVNQHRFDDFEYEAQVEDIEVQDPNMDRVRTLEMFKEMPAIVVGVGQSMGDPAAAIRIMAEKFNMPELDEVWPNAQSMMHQQMMAQFFPQGGPSGMQQGGGGGQAAIMPQNQMASDNSQERRV